jgi:hypothetical protein
MALCGAVWLWNQDWRSTFPDRALREAPDSARLSEAGCISGSGNASMRDAQRLNSRHDRLGRRMP